MAKFIYLKVAKVGSMNADMTTDIETNTITLEDGKNYINFLKHIHVQNYIMKTPPVVVKVVNTRDGVEVGEIDSASYQKQLQKYLDKMKAPEKDVDYKSKFEEQAEQMEAQSDQMAKLMERLEALESGSNKSDDREALEAKAKELDISFRSNIGDDKLLAKIQEIEPEFNL